MIINNDVIMFQSNAYLYAKEKTGIKNNTVRILPIEELEVFRNSLRALDHIRISKVGDKDDYFVRKIQDISFFEDLIIFTWAIPCCHSI
jgi:Neuraminidase (sialidase)